MCTPGGPNSKCKGPAAEQSFVVLGRGGMTYKVRGERGGRKGQGGWGT